MILKYCIYCNTYITDYDPFNLKGACSLCGKIKTQPSKEKPPIKTSLVLMGFDNPDELKPWILRPLNEKEKENTKPLNLDCVGLLF